MTYVCWIAEWDPWGIPDDHEIEMVEDDSPIPKHVPQHRPPRLPKEFQETLEALMSQPGKTEKLEELISRKDNAAASSSEEPSKP
jgi:NADH dehydrogenase (ubiquinone) 1 alpha subcomplex subunit 5